MATEKTGEWQETEAGAAANESGWGETVDAESQVVLEGEGDGFIATYVDMDSTQSGIKQLHLEDVYDLRDQYAGKYMFFNVTRDLEQKLKRIPPKSQIRVEWVSSLPTGQKDPMRVYSVQWR